MRWVFGVVNDWGCRVADTSCFFFFFFFFFYDTLLRSIVIQSFHLCGLVEFRGVLLYEKIFEVVWWSRAADLGAAPLRAGRRWSPGIDLEAREALH
jgi:hypothetical protein